MQGMRSKKVKAIKDRGSDRKVRERYIQYIYASGYVDMQRKIY